MLAAPIRTSEII